MYVLEQSSASIILFPFQILALFALPATEDVNQVRCSWEFCGGFFVWLVLGFVFHLGGWWWFKHTHLSWMPLKLRTFGVCINTSEHKSSLALLANKMYLTWHVDICYHTFKFKYFSQTESHIVTACIHSTSLPVPLLHSNPGIEKTALPADNH